MPTQPRTRLVELVILALALAIASGFAINWVDTPPNWDDTRITVGVLLLLLLLLLLLTTGLLVFLAPRRAENSKVDRPGYDHSVGSAPLAVAFTSRDVFAE